MKLALGTAQFGLDYGINNPAGKVRPAEVDRILSFAGAGGIRVIDTANAYGTSEEVIGGYLKTHEHHFSVISKYVRAPGVPDLRTVFETALARLAVPRLYGYLVHGIRTFEADPAAWETLRELKAAGRVEKIGFSLYSPSELASLFDRGISFDLIQIPYSVFDRRFEPWFPRLHERGIEVHVRSVFLQGLFFKEPAALDGIFLKIKPKLERLRSIAESAGLPLAKLCLGFALRNEEIDRVVVGVDSLENLKGNMLEPRELAAVPADELEALRESDETILLPYLWKK